MNKKAIICTVAILILLVGASVIYFIMDRSSEAETENSSSMSAAELESSNSPLETSSEAPTESEPKESASETTSSEVNSPEADALIKTFAEIGEPYTLHSRYYNQGEAKTDDAPGLGWDGDLEHISPSTIHDIHKVLRCAFNQAKKWEYIAKNPFLDATLPEHKEAKRDALTPEQLQRVLDFTDRTDIYDLYVIHCAIQLAFACCMRGGEVGGAQWERFSRSDQVLYIDRVIDRVDKKLIEKLPKMDILFRFPNLYPGTRTVIVLKQPKTEGSIRTVYIPETVAKKLEKLREMQMKLKLELGDDGYMDYGLIICQANGRPIMTEHLNKRFKEVLVGLNDPTIDVDHVVFHSLRHTSTGVKLRLSKGDLKAVQGDGGWNSPDMVTKRYAHILDEDRRRLADEMEQSFYKSKTEETPDTAAPALDAEALASLLASNPELLKKALESVQLANNT